MDGERSRVIVMAKASKKKKRQRSERRFEPSSTSNAMMVRVVGAIGAIGMGAGVYGQFAPGMRVPPGQPIPYAAWILAAGAIVLGAAIWMGTSGEPALRVGDGGVGTEKGGLRRMPWWAIERVAFSDGAVRVAGTDDMGDAISIAASLLSQPQAAAWIVKEARARVPDVVDIPEGVEIPEASASSGVVVALDPPQVVGKRCAASDKAIAYEPDARVCPRCERVYHKAHVPDECACGASLTHLQPHAKGKEDSEAEAS
jgi:hypothetical protein